MLGAVLPYHNKLEVCKTKVQVMLCCVHFVMKGPQGPWVLQRDLPEGPDPARLRVALRVAQEVFSFRQEQSSKSCFSSRACAFFWPQVKTELCDGGILPLNPFLVLGLVGLPKLQRVALLLDERILVLQLSFFFSALCLSAAVSSSAILVLYISSTDFYACMPMLRP